MQKKFKRSFDALKDVFEFTASFYAAEAVAEQHRFGIDFCIEELFTNMVKYQAGNPNEILVQIDRVGPDAVVRLVDFDVDAFDVTKAGPPVDVDAPLEERKPGGLGLHLVPRMIDGIDYSHADRISTITLTKTLR
jgi:serine/threonine-protein kinase RsbW